MSQFNINFYFGRTAGRRKGVLGHITSDNSSGVTVRAFPIYAVLQALKVTVIDFLSLDVEGFELKVSFSSYHSRLN